MIEYHRLAIPGLDAFIGSGVLGDSYGFMTEGFTGKENFPYLTVHHVGEVDQVCSNLAGTQVLGSGVSSADSMLFAPGCGYVTRTVTTPTYSYFCLADVAKRKLEATAVRLQPGDSFSVPVGHLLFLATGRVAVLGQVLTAPSYIEAVTLASLVTATEAVIALCILRLPEL